MNTTYRPQIISSDRRNKTKNKHEEEKERGEETQNAIDLKLENGRIHDDEIN